MLKRKLSAIILTLLLTWMATWAFNIRSAKTNPSTITVPDDYPTIQQAVDAADPGDIVYVKQGTYYEHLVLGKNVSLYGEDPGNTVIDGNNTGEVVAVNEDGAMVDGFTIQNGSFGILATSVARGNISRNIVKNCFFGVSLQSCLMTDLSDNIIISNQHGIRIVNSANVRMRRNNLTDNLYNFDVSVDTENTPMYVHDIDASNYLDGKPMYYLVNQRDIEIPSNAGFVAAVNCDNISARSLDLRNNVVSVLFISSNDSLIQKLNISDNEAYGISLVRSEHNVISENTVNNSQWAIRLWYSSIGNEIYGNFVTDSGYGILLHGPLCDQNRIFNNTAMGNYYGIHLGGETYMNVIERNVLTNNTIGLSMDANSMNIWRENMVEGNNVGLYAWATLNNYFYHNNFVGNRRGVSLKDARDFWDNGCEGNYWSDYNGTDLDNDGVGDTELPWLGVDYFPLVNPFWNAGDVNHDSRINGKDVAILCKAYGTEQGEPNWNPHADENSDLKIDGEDIAIVATYFNAHFP